MDLKNEEENGMKYLKTNLGGIVICLFEILVGILLLINPVGFTAGIITGAGIVLMLGGILSVIKYFRTDAEEAASGQMLVKGLVALLTGAFCTFKSEWFIVTFPVITLVYGVVVLVTGLGKVQWMVDAIRLKNKNWFLAAISALLSIICGAVIIKSPFSTTTVLWMFTGISLIVEAIFDVVVLFLNSKDTKNIQNDAETEVVFGEVSE